MLGARRAIGFIRTHLDTGQTFSMTLDDSWQEPRLNRSCLSFSNSKKKSQSEPPNVPLRPTPAFLEPDRNVRLPPIADSGAILERNTEHCTLFNVNNFKPADKRRLA